MALVETAPYGNRCDRYCESFGHVCVAAAEEENDNCEVKFHTPCDVEFTMTSDMLCKCSRAAPPVARTPPAARARPVEPGSAKAPAEPGAAAGGRAGDLARVLQALRP